MLKGGGAQQFNRRENSKQNCKTSCGALETSSQLILMILFEHNLECK